MATHIALYNDPELVSDVTPSFLSLSAVPDQILAFRNGAHVPSSPLLLLGLAATGGDATAELVGARVQSPKTVISPLYTRPVNSDSGAVFPSGQAHNFARAVRRSSSLARSSATAPG